MPFATIAIEKLDDVKDLETIAAWVFDDVEVIDCDDIIVAA